MAKFIVRRLGISFLILLVVTFLIYSLLRLLGSVTRRDLRWFVGIFKQK